MKLNESQTKRNRIKEIFEKAAEKNHTVIDLQEASFISEAAASELLYQADKKGMELKVEENSNIEKMLNMISNRRENGDLDPLRSKY